MQETENSLFLMKIRKPGQKKEAEVSKRENVVRNGRYRLFCGETVNPLFENALYIRTLVGKAVTRPVYSESVKKFRSVKKLRWCSMRTTMRMDCRASFTP